MIGGNGMKEIIYLDNAASSWPKPPEVLEAMKECLEEYAANPGRGGHTMAIRASRVLFEARKNLAKLFRIPNPNDIFFYMNTSQALNQAIKGLLRPGDHVITTGLEHNSVRRPLEFLKRTIGIEISYLENDPDGTLDMSKLSKSIREKTRLIVTAHASNLLGTLMPIEKIGEIAKEHGCLLLVDAAQTAGIIPIDVQKMNIDMLAFPGHKALYGPQGTAGLYVHPTIDLVPLIHGGTGSKSEEIDQPSTRPDRYETGTPNTVGIAGLNAALKFIHRTGLEEIHNREQKLIEQILQGLLQTPNVEVYGLRTIEERVGVIAFNVKGLDASEVAFILDQQYGIAVRSGYHCTPLGHMTARTTSMGAVRASVSYFTSNEEVDKFLQAIKELSEAMEAGEQG
jgi:cysteine desulfurase family protein